MRKQYEQICMDDYIEVESEPCDALDLLMMRPKAQQRLWKYLWNNRDLDGHLSTTQKEIGEAMNVGAPNISSSMRGLINADMVQRDGIHFYINPHHWWYGEDHRKQTARTEWDKRKEICGTNNNK
jgi:uncharacterized protein YneR